MKSIPTKIILVLALFAAQQSKAVYFDWARYYNGAGIDRGLHSMTDALGNAYLTGVAAVPGGNKIISSAYSDAGSLLSLRIGNTFLPGTAVQVERDNALNTYVLCRISSSSYTLIKYNKGALESWRKNYSNLVIKFKVGNPAAVYVCGITTAGVVMNRLNRNTGLNVWTRTYLDATLLPNSNNSDFTIDENSNVYFAGTSELGGAIEYDYRLIKLTKNGVQIYNILHDGPSGEDEEAFRICANSTGELYVLGDYDCYIPVRDFVSMVKFDTLGGHLWHTQFTTSGISARYYPLEVMVGDDGNPVCVGDIRDFYNVNPAGATQRIEVTKFDLSTGAIIYDVFPDDAAYSNPDLLESAKCMTMDTLDNIYIGGSSNTYGGVSVEPYRWLALKVNGTTGTREWVEAGVGDADALNEMADVAVNSSFDSYWAGSENFAGNVNMWITKYCESGCFSPRLGNPTDLESSVSVYPNPSTSSFTFLTNEENSFYTLSIYDITGKLMEEQTSSAVELTFGQSLPPGVYIVKFVREDEVKTIRVIKS